MFRLKLAEKAALKAKEKAEDELRLQSKLKQEAEAGLKDQIFKMKKKEDALKHRSSPSYRPCILLLTLYTLESKILMPISAETYVHSIVIYISSIYTSPVSECCHPSSYVRGK